MLSKADTKVALRIPEAKICPQRSLRVIFSQWVIDRLEPKGFEIIEQVLEAKFSGLAKAGFGYMAIRHIENVLEKYGMILIDDRLEHLSTASSLRRILKKTRLMPFRKAGLKTIGEILDLKFTGLLEKKISLQCIQNLQATLAEYGFELIDDNLPLSAVLFRLKKERKLVAKLEAAQIITINDALKAGFSGLRKLGFYPSSIYFLERQLTKYGLHLPGCPPKKERDTHSKRRVWQEVSASTP